MVRPGDAVAAAPRYIGAMRNAPVFSLPRLDRLGDRLAAARHAGVPLHARPDVPHHKTPQTTTLLEVPRSL